MNAHLARYLLTEHAPIVKPGTSKIRGFSLEYGYTASGACQRKTLPQRIALMLCCALAIGVMSCRGFEDRYTGTYIEVRDDLDEELLVVDLFRFGDYSNAIVRTYRVPQSSEPTEILDNELRCAWTALGDAPDDDGNLFLTVPSSIEREELTIRGRISGQTLDVELRGGQDPGEEIEVVRKQLRFYRERANTSCEERRPFFIQPDFDAKRQGIPLSSGHEIKRPVFAMLWLGVQARRVNSTIVWVAKNVLSSSFYLSGNEIDTEINGLQGRRSLSVLPPESRALTQSGDTRFALGHFVVIDDACGQANCADPLPDTFSWDVEQEPIIAASIERGQEIDGSIPNAVGLGKALFYVEGKLSELHPNTQVLIENIDRYIEDRDNAHFFIVDFYYDDNGNIIRMRLPSDPRTLTNLSYRIIPVAVTPDYLKANEILLPRLLPIEDL